VRRHRFLSLIELVFDVPFPPRHRLTPPHAIRPVYGVIFLFKYPISQGKAEKPVDGEFDYGATENLFFANQVIQNACATQAILSVLLNRQDLDVGGDLKEFREFTQAFPSDLRGEALSNSGTFSLWVCFGGGRGRERERDKELMVVDGGKELIRTVHNSFARSSPFIDEGTRAATEDDDVYHFIAYTALNGQLYELDGLQPSPISHGACEDGEFADNIIPVLQRRIGRYPATEIRFNLLAMIQDPRIRAREIADFETVEREDQKREAWKWENELRRHNFVGFTHEMLKTVIRQKVKEGKYEEWIDGAKAKTRERLEERRGKGGEDVEMEL
jgi:ubiquitin carboxyl-terminal hydrolase L5